MHLQQAMTFVVYAGTVAFQPHCLWKQPLRGDPERRVASDDFPVKLLDLIGFLHSSHIAPEQCIRQGPNEATSVAGTALEVPHWDQSARRGDDREGFDPLPDLPSCRVKPLRSLSLAGPVRPLRHPPRRVRLLAPRSRLSRVPRLLAESLALAAPSPPLVPAAQLADRRVRGRLQGVPPLGRHLLCPSAVGLDRPVTGAVARQ
mmetsp:Transcript_30563/g.74440  ORF Transcript_30563/g.74440 Transcript_30563/m.74440 type:complete len:203 (-) Transcript_30563:442-1050(-)